MRGFAAALVTASLSGDGATDDFSKPRSRPLANGRVEDETHKAKDVLRRVLNVKTIERIGTWTAGVASGVLLDLAVRRLCTEKPAPLETLEPQPEPPAPARTVRALTVRQLVQERVVAIATSRRALKLRGAVTGVSALAAVLVLRRKADFIRKRFVHPTAEGGQARRAAMRHGVPVLPIPKAKGPGAPPPKAPQAGPKGKAPPPKAGAKSKAAPGPKAKAGQAKQASGGQEDMVAESPFGRRIHWVKPVFDGPIEDTIFGKLGGAAPQFDSKLLTAFFENGSATKARKSWTVARPTGKCLLDTQRAQAAAIMINKLRMTTQELCRCVNALDLSCTRLGVDDIEIVSMAMPTLEESTKLMKYKDEIEQLRDVEQKLMPLCGLNPGQLRVMKFGMAHVSTFAGVSHRCGVVRLAAEEAQRSTPLMEFFRVVLQVGNYINHGAAAEKQAGVVRGFAIESLPMLATCKAGPVSALHFICITLKTENPDFMQALKSSLRHTREAAREKFTALETDVTSFGKEVAFVRERSKKLDAEDACADPMAGLLADIEREEATLRGQLSGATAAAREMQTYFNVASKDSKPPTAGAEEFFNSIVACLNVLQTAWSEVEQHGKRWRRQFVDPDPGAQPEALKRHSWPAKTTQALEESEMPTTRLDQRRTSDASTDASAQAAIEAASAKEAAQQAGGGARRRTVSFRLKKPRSGQLEPPRGRVTARRLPSRQPRQVSDEVVRQVSKEEVRQVSNGGRQVSSEVSSKDVCQFHCIHDDSDGEPEDVGLPGFRRSCTSFETDPDGDFVATNWESDQALYLSSVAYGMFCSAKAKVNKGLADTGGGGGGGGIGGWRFSRQTTA